MNILPLNTFQNNPIQFQANPKIILTKDMVKTMRAEDIIELSDTTLKKQDVNIIRMLRAKINTFIQVLTSRYSHLKANELNFSSTEIEQTKADKKKAKRIEKLLSAKIREEKIKKGNELNSGANATIPIEYLILPEEEKIHQKMIKMQELIIDNADANRYKYQRAKHDRNLSRIAMSQISRLLKERETIQERHCLDTTDIDYDYQTKKTYNSFVEQILFAGSKGELTRLQEKICETKLVNWLKEDLIELISRKINLL